MTKSEIVAHLISLGLDLSASKIKKTSVADLTTLAVETKKVADAAVAAELVKTKRAVRASKKTPAKKVAKTPRVLGARVLGEPRPASEIKPCGSGTKKAAIMNAIADPKGASIEELVAITGWTRSATLSGLTLDMVKLCGVGVRRDANERYHLILPAGMHTVPIFDKVVHENRASALSSFCK